MNKFETLVGHPADVAEDLNNLTETNNVTLIISEFEGEGDYRKLRILVELEPKVDRKSSLANEYMEMIGGVKFINGRRARDQEHST